MPIRTTTKHRFRGRRKAVTAMGTLAAAGALIAYGGTSAASAAPMSSSPTTVSFTTAGCSTWAVPSGVTSVQIQATGAAGGGADGNSGGTGDGVSAGLSGLSASQTLDICVDYGGGSAGTPGPGDPASGDGGGASGVSLGSDFSSPVLVAGGGGGALNQGNPEDGGNAGYPSGQAGQSAFNAADAGGGGTQTAGGAGGTADGSPGSNGAGFTASGPGAGGAGGNAYPSYGSGGGGGGAGYYGGGGSGGTIEDYGAGGGGGSDFCTDTVTVTDCAFSSGAGTGTGAGSAAGDAMVTITYQAPAATTTTTDLASSANPSVVGQQVTYTATVSPTDDGGTVSFSDGGTPITGCTAQTLNALGQATCQVTYTAADTHSITASYSGDSAYAGSTSTMLTQTVKEAAQVITFTTAPPSPAVVGGTYTPAATGGASGEPVTFGIDSASTTGACSYSSATGEVSFTGPGTCIIDANQAGGNGYTAAPQVQQVITVDQAPAFTVDSPPATATAGQVYSYAFVASGTPAPTYALASGAPSWLTIDSATGEVSGTAPSGTKSFSYSVTASNAAGTATAGPFTVTVTAASTKADLAAGLSCPGSLTVGKTGTCTLTVTNHGPAAAQKLAAAIALPASLGETACSTGCTRLGNVITWTTASLADGATVIYTVTVKAAAAGKALVLAAAASASPDPDPLNNIALASVTITK